MQHSQPAALRGPVKTTLAAIAFALGASACAPIHGLPSSPDALASSQVVGCTPISTESPARLAIEADIAAFVRSAPAAESARFEVQDCVMDGQYDGKTIFVSSRLARLPQAQRHFIIAHEFAHHRLAHHAQAGAAPAGILSQHGQPIRAADVTDIAHRSEFEADADAVRTMHAAGFDPEEAARLFDSMGAGKDSATHPAFSRRAQAIRDVIATLSDPAAAPQGPETLVAGSIQHPATAMP